MNALRKACEQGSIVALGRSLVANPARQSNVPERAWGCVTQHFAYSTPATVTGTNSPGRPDAGSGKPLRDPFDLEYDRFNGGTTADAEGIWQQRSPLSPLEGPVDIEQEYDRDDPEAVDINALYDEESPNEEDELLGREIDLDDEYDLMHDHQSGSSEAPTPSPSARPMAAGVKEADPRGMNEDPKAPSGAFEQGRHKFPSDSPGGGHKYK